MLPFDHGVGVVNRVTHFEQIFPITMKEKRTSGLFLKGQIFSAFFVLLLSSCPNFSHGYNL